MVEKIFKILIEKIFKELIGKLKLNLNFVLDAFVCAYILYSLLRSKREFHV